MVEKREAMLPKEIVEALDKYVIGQDSAKRAVANALRNRWRRAQLPEELRKEITPKNILMIGPTGVGKTEIARRLSELVDAPFIKVEATKFTEVGYVGRDVESIIRDLVDISIKMVREKEFKAVEIKAAEAAEERILDALLPKPKNSFSNEPEAPISDLKKKEESATRQLYRKKLRAGDLDEKEIEIKVSASPVGMEILGPPGMEEMIGNIREMMQSVSSKRRVTLRLKVKDAFKRLKEDESAKLINEEDIKAKAIESVEQNGIVFLDEMDKIVRPEGVKGSADVSREGVQRDLLPLVEGTTVSTKHGWVKTDHILFIASGAFHLAKPSDLIPELQGRFPIRVELNALKVADFIRILTEPNASLTEQYVALMSTEGVRLHFQKDAIRRLAEIAYKVNDRSENIGARRLHTILEKLLEEISFEECQQHKAKGQDKEKLIKINAKYVDLQLAKLAEDRDLSQYIL